MEKTKRGIYLNLYKSLYKSEVYGYTFVFSSKVYLSKFEERLKEYAESLKAQIIFKSGLEVDSSLYSAFSLYRKIEKRGFLVYDKEGNEIIYPTFEIILK